MKPAGAARSSQRDASARGGDGHAGLDLGLDALPIGVLTVDRRLLVRQANAQGRRMLGVRRGAAALDRRLLDGLDEDSRRRLLEALAPLSGRRGVSCGEVRLFSRRGTARVMRVQARAQGAGQEIVLAFVDVTRERRAADRVAHAAHHDALTGLPNRARAMTLLAQAVERARKSQSQMGLMFVDLDRFKEINDTLGHDAGDRLLREVARRLRESAQPDGQPARLGGDEFLVLLPSLAGHDDARCRAERVAHGLRQPWQLGQRHIRPSASIGVSRFPTDATDTRSLLHRADLALYRAKREGRDGVRLYCPIADGRPAPAAASATAATAAAAA